VIKNILVETAGGSEHWTIDGVRTYRQGRLPAGLWQPEVMEDHEGSRAGRPARQAADLPAGYPQEYQQVVTLRDGRRVLIRPIQPGDAPALAEAIRSADADTIRLRYLGGHPRVTPGLLKFLTNVDYTSRFALVAVEPASRRGIAIARYEPAGQDGTADVAIAVTPGWRDAGLATELLRMLARAASERGIHTFTGTYLAENRPVTALINTPEAITDQVTAHGIIEFSVALPPVDPGPGPGPS
jgi:RimJ/RimL family protein N-acetyltransferase